MHNSVPLLLTFLHHPLRCSFQVFLKSPGMRWFSVSLYGTLPKSAFIILMSAAPTLRQTPYWPLLGQDIAIQREEQSVLVLEEFTLPMTVKLCALL